MLKISRIETVLDDIQTPAYVCEEILLEQNLQLLKEVSERSGVTILLALKGFAFKALAPLVDKKFIVTGKQIGRAHV